MTVYVTKPKFNLRETLSSLSFVNKLKNLTRFDVDVEGNTVLGGTRKNWILPVGVFKYIQLPGGALASYSNGTTNNQISIVNNAYRNISASGVVGTYRFINGTAEASWYNTFGGTHNFYSSSTSGAADAEITWRRGFQANQYGIGLGDTAPTSGMGIAFPATQSASSDANTLDDYEEGTWVPTSPSITFASASGSYTKIGRMVYASFTVTWPTTSDTNNARIQGLPFNTTVNSGFALQYSNQSNNYFGTLPTAGSPIFDFYTAAGALLTNVNFSGANVRGIFIYQV